MNFVIQIGISAVQVLVALALVLAFHQLRGRQGLAPFFLLLGGMEIFTAILTALWIHTELPFGFTLVTGSTSFFVVSFTGLLLVYLSDGTLQARYLILSLISLQICYIIWRYLILVQMVYLGGSLLGSPIFDRVFVPQIQLNVAAAIAKIVSLLFLIVFYQWFSNRFTNWPLWAKIFMVLACSLVFNDTLFYIIGIFGTPSFIPSYLGSVLSRPVSALLISPILAAYLQYSSIAYKPVEDVRHPMNIFQGNASLRASLAESEARYENLFENANELIYMADPETGRILDANQHVLDETGYSLEEMTRCTLFDVHPAEDHPLLKRLVHLAMTREKQSLPTDTVLFCQDKRHLPVALKSYQVTVKGKPVVVLLAHDISDRQRAIEGLRHTNRLKDEFLQNISHELRTPLCAILGWSDLLVSDAIDPQQKAVGGQQIKSSSEKLLQLVNDLLDLSKIESGKMELEIQLEDINNPIRAAYQILLFAAKNKGLTVTLDLATGLPPAQIDVSRTQQIGLNLLSNAIKFTDEGGHITIISREKGNLIEVAVSDTGVGIDARALPFIFEGFRQEDGSPTRRFGGTGIGLALVKSLVELHGGTVGVESVVGKGSTFTFRFPAVHHPVAPSPFEAQESSAAPAASTEIFDPPTERASARRVLIIDDDENLLKLVGAIVRGAGYETTLAGGGQEGLEAIRDFVPDLILLDIGMPEMDGFETFTAIRRDRRLERVKVVALTAYANLKDKEHILKHGFDEYLSKPFKREQLLTVLSRLMTS